MSSRLTEDCNANVVRTTERTNTLAINDNSDSNRLYIQENDKGKQDADMPESLPTNRVDKDQAAARSKVHGEAISIEIEYKETEEQQQSQWHLFCPCCRKSIDRFNIMRQRLAHVVNSKQLELFVLALIVINTITLGIATLDAIRENNVAYRVLERVDFVILNCFTLELGLHMLVHGWRFFKDGWLVFDLILVISSWSLSSVTIIRAFRVFRTLRLVSRVKVMRKLVLAIFTVIPRMMAICALNALISYIFAVMFTDMFKDMYEQGHTDYDYFGRLDHTLFTLFQLMTLNDWADVLRQLLAVHTWAWIPVMFYMVVSSFIVFNLIIAVVCEAMAAVNDIERRAEEEEHDRQQELRPSQGKNVEATEKEGDEEEEDDEFFETVSHTSVALSLPQPELAWESYINELVRRQEHTLQALQILTQQLAEHKQQQKQRIPSAGTARCHRP